MSISQTLQDIQIFALTYVKFGIYCNAKMFPQEMLTTYVQYETWRVEQLKSTCKSTNQIEIDR